MPGFGDSPMPGFGDSPMPGFGDSFMPGFGGSPMPGFGDSPSAGGIDMDQKLDQMLNEQLDLAARFPMQCCTKDAAACNQTSTCTYEGGVCRPTDPQFNDEPGEGGASPPWGATGMPGSSPPWDGLYPEPQDPPNATVAFAFSFSSAADSDVSGLEDKFASIFSKASKIPMHRIEVEVKAQPTPMRKLSQSGGAPGQTFIVTVIILAESVSEGRMAVKALTEGILQGAGTAGFPKLEEALKEEGVTFSSIDLVMKPEVHLWEGMPGSGSSPPWDGTGMPGSGSSPPWDDTGMPGSGSSPPWDDAGMPTKPDGGECAERMVRAPSPTLLGPHPPGARRRRGKVVWGAPTWATRRRPPSSRWW